MYKLFTDGGSRGNPGEAAYGALIYDKNDILVDFTADYIGSATNNVAEYYGLVNGLELIIRNNIKYVEIFMDSELIVKQINGEYKVRDENMKKLYKEVQELLKEIKEYRITHVKRSLNKHADRLVNLILDCKNSA